MKYHIPFCILAELPQNVLAHCKECVCKEPAHTKYSSLQNISSSAWQNKADFKGRQEWIFYQQLQEAGLKSYLVLQCHLVNSLPLATISSGGDKHWKSTLMFSVLSKLSDFEQYILISPIFLCRHPLGIYLLDVYSLSYPFLLTFCNNLLRTAVMRLPWIVWDAEFLIDEVNTHSCDSDSQNITGFP